MTTASNPLGKDESLRPGGIATQKTRLVSVRSGYALWAPTYDQAPSPILALEERALNSLLPDLSGKVVLDVACGTGRWLRKLVEGGAQAAIGLDLSFEMLARTRHREILGGKLIQGDACAMPVRSGIVDIVLASFVAGYVGDLRAFASELRRVARPGARIFISDLHPSAYHRGWRRTFRLGAEVIEIFSHRRPLKQFCETFQAEGLEIERCLEPPLGEPERFLFKQAGKEDLFDLAQEGPAICLCKFRKPGNRPE